MREFSKYFDYCATCFYFKGDPSEAIQITKTFKIYNSKPLKYTIAQNHVQTRVTHSFKNLLSVEHVFMPV